MSIRTKFILGFLAIFITGFYFLVDFIANEIRPRYLETVEESMNDTAHLLASLVENNMRGASIDTGQLQSMFTTAFSKHFSAQIYSYNKKDIGLHVYVTDDKGIVIFDSDNGRFTGRDFSMWNDVYRTLRGQYGARSTQLDPDDPATNALYVAAPILHNDHISGVLTVIKSEQSVAMFMDLARKKIIKAAILLCLAFILLSFFLSMWINGPIMRLTAYVRSVKEKKRAVLPALAGREIRMLGEAFEDMKNELEGRKYTEHYVQTLTHELKSPLSSVIASAELLTEDMDTGQRRRFIDNILHESRRILRIINRLLQLASLENRKGLNDVQDIDLAALMEEILEGLEPQVRKKNLGIKVDVDGEHRVRGERFLVHHAVMNVLDNAINFSEPGGHIFISSRRDEKNTEISITDEGSGIPDYAMEKVFDRFYSLPSSDAHKKGTGLGLAFVREALTLHGGSVTLHNNPPRGVRASLVFPRNE